MFVYIEERNFKFEQIQTLYKFYKEQKLKMLPLEMIVVKQYSISKRTFWRWVKKLHKPHHNLKYK